MILEFDHKELVRVMDHRFCDPVNLAEAVGTTRQTVYRWLRGAAKPSTKNFKAICEHLNVEPERLLIERSGEPWPK